VNKELFYNLRIFLPKKSAENFLVNFLAEKIRGNFRANIYSAS